MQRLVIVLTAACFSVSAAQALPAGPHASLRSEIASAAGAYASDFVPVKDTGKPGTPNTSQFQAPRSPPDDSAKQNKPSPKTGGIPASVVAPKPKR